MIWRKTCFDRTCLRKQPDRFWPYSSILVSFLWSSTHLSTYSAPFHSTIHPQPFCHERFLYPFLFPKCICPPFHGLFNLSSFRPPLINWRNHPLEINISSQRHQKNQMRNLDAHLDHPPCQWQGAQPSNPAFPIPVVEFHSFGVNRSIQPLPRVQPDHHPPLQLVRRRCQSPPRTPRK